MFAIDKELMDILYIETTNREKFWFRSSTRISQFSLLRIMQSITDATTKMNFEVKFLNRKQSKRTRPSSAKGIRYVWKFSSIKTFNHCNSLTNKISYRFKAVNAWFSDQTAATWNQSWENNKNCNQIIHCENVWCSDVLISWCENLVDVPSMVPSDCNWFSGEIHLLIYSSNMVWLPTDWSVNYIT